MFQTTAQIVTGQSVIRSHFRAPLVTVLLPSSVTRVLYRDGGETSTTLIPECMHVLDGLCRGSARVQTASAQVLYRQALIIGLPGTPSTLSIPALCNGGQKKKQG